MGYLPKMNLEKVDDAYQQRNRSQYQRPLKEDSPQDTYDAQINKIANQNTQPNRNGGYTK
jgi:hypothetical protein